MENKNQQSREKQGNIASLVGICVNLLLAIGKIAVGSLFGVVSVLADGLNNLSDSGSSIMSVISFKLSSKPADEKHPYGHQRIEYVFSMVVAFLILLIAFELAKESVSKIFNPSEMEFSIIILIVLAVSIFAKLGLYFYNMGVAKRINSEILKATATDCITDSVSTSVVLVSIIVWRFSGLNIDGYVGILVALFIAWSGVNVLKETLSHLIGKAPDAEMKEEILKRIFAYDSVLGVHDLNVYSYGPEKYFASVHIEVDAKVNVLTSHEIVDEIERDFALNTNILLTGHLDPIVTDNEEVNKMKIKVIEIIKGIDERFSMHDFRVVEGERRTNLIFDVVIPYKTKISGDDIKREIEEKVKAFDKKYFTVITVEHETI